VVGIVAAFLLAAAPISGRNVSPANVTGADSVASLVAPAPCTIKASAGGVGELDIEPLNGWALRPPYRLSIAFSLSTVPGTPVVGGARGTFTSDPDSKKLRFTFDIPKFDATEGSEVSLSVQLEGGTAKGPWTAFTTYRLGPCTAQA